MKEIFTYISIVALSIFSFYYTDKVISVLRENDPIMIEIMNVEDYLNTSCLEGKVTSEGVIIGIEGKVINKIESYKNMRGIGYDESLLVFEDSECVVTKNAYLNKYIISGNSNKNSVSLIIDVKEENIDEYNKLALEKNVDFTYMVDETSFKKYKEKLLIKAGNNVIYSGIDKKILKEYIKYMKQNNLDSYCISYEEDNLNICAEEGINTIKTNNYFEKNVYSKSKEVLKSGEFIIIKDKLENIDELKILINYIRNKGYKIININTHLE